MTFTTTRGLKFFKGGAEKFKMKIETLVGGIIGGILGAAFGALGTHVVESKRFMTRLENEASKIRTFYEKEKATSERKSEEPASESDRDSKDEAGDKKNDSKNTVNFTKEEVDNYKDKTSLYQGALNIEKDKQVNYNKFTEPTKSKKEPPKQAIPKRNVDEKPYRITGDEYYNTFPEFGKVKATWWAQSHELIDEEDTILDVEETIGIENLLEWPDDGVIFVRNILLGIDYEITFCDSRYDYNLY